jgi:transcriptional regulator with XRE-family HTH domain
MRRFLRQRVPDGVHPLVRRLFELMNAQRCGVLDLAERCGVTSSTIRHWRASSQEKRSKTPSIASFDATLRALGYRLEIVPIEGRYRADAAEAIEAWKGSGLTPADAALGIGLSRMTWQDVGRLVMREAPAVRALAARAVGRGEVGR